MTEWLSRDAMETQIRMVEAYRAGTSVLSIARQAGVSRDVVYRVLRRAHVAMRSEGRRPKTPEQAKCRRCEIVLAESGLVGHEAAWDETGLCHMCAEEVYGGRTNTRHAAAAPVGDRGRVRVRADHHAGQDVRV